jgi:hypothetical protein
MPCHARTSERTGVVTASARSLPALALSLPALMYYYSGGWDVGRIYETRGGPENMRWFWSMTVNGPMTRSNRVATLEERKAQWDERKAWANLEERS